MIDALDAHATELSGVRVHQMHALYDHPYLHGAYGDHLRHVSYFLSPVTRPAFSDGDCDLVPAHFSEMPLTLRRETKRQLVVAAASPPDRHGYVSLGTNADYTARFIGELPFFIEVNPNMPRTFGENSMHLSQVVGWAEADYPLIESPPPAISQQDREIATLVAERIPHGATIQAGIGASTERDSRSAARSSSPRAPHRARVRRRHGPLRVRCAHGYPQGHAAGEDGRERSHSALAVSTISCTTTARWSSCPSTG